MLYLIIFYLSLKRKSTDWVCKYLFFHSTFLPLLKKFFRGTEKFFKKMALIWNKIKNRIVWFDDNISNFEKKIDWLNLHIFDFSLNIFSSIKIISYRYGQIIDKNGIVLKKNNIWNVLIWLNSILFWREIRLTGSASLYF